MSKKNTKTIATVKNVTTTEISVDELMENTKIAQKQNSIWAEFGPEPAIVAITGVALQQKAYRDETDIALHMKVVFEDEQDRIRITTIRAFYRKNENSFIKAVIDENNKGFLGSRIRFRLLEDIFVGNRKIEKGSILYGQISGFSMQRVDLKIVSVFTKGEILPVNLSIYDIDGLKGLYVPESVFRDMIREMGSNSVQGTQMDMGGQGFFTSIGSKLFTSTSKSIANLIKTNKAKLKYNSYVFLIDEKQLKDSQNQQKK